MRCRGGILCVGQAWRVPLSAEGRAATHARRDGDSARDGGLVSPCTREGPVSRGARHACACDSPAGGATGNVRHDFSWRLFRSLSTAGTFFFVLLRRMLVCRAWPASACARACVLVHRRCDVLCAVLLLVLVFRRAHSCAILVVPCSCLYCLCVLSCLASYFP